MRVAFTTIGVLVNDWDHPEVEGFVERVPGVFRAAESGDGFVDRAGRSEEEGEEGKEGEEPLGDWGEVEPPGFLDPEHHPRLAMTLSVWEDLESVFAFTYAGAHGEALKHRKQWAVKSGLPSYAAWWIENDETPNWQDVKTRLEILHEKGSTPQAFTFKQPYGPDGAALAIDQARVKQKIKKNTARIPPSDGKRS